MKIYSQFFKFCLRLGVLSLLVVFLTSSVLANDKAEKKAKLQAAYVYNILRYTRWSEENSEGDILLAVQGDNLLSTQLASLDGKMIGGRKLKVMTFDPENIKGLSVVLFTEKGKHSEFLKRDDLLGLLTICDCPKFTQEGGMISLVEVNKRLRFKVNLKALKKGEVSLSSRLLQLAIIEGGED